MVEPGFHHQPQSKDPLIGRNPHRYTWIHYIIAIVIIVGISNRDRRMIFIWRKYASQNVSIASSKPIINI